MNTQLATLMSNLDFPEECIESLDDLFYISLASLSILEDENLILDPHLSTSLDFSGASIIKTQIDLCESMLYKVCLYKSF